jgi:hypothetical protein
VVFETWPETLSSRTVLILRRFMVESIVKSIRSRSVVKKEPMG